MRVRALAICAALAGCGRPDVPATPRAPTSTAPVAGAPSDAAPVDADAPRSPALPGPRLVEGVAPTAVDLTLELDPDRTSFAGRVAITIAIAAPTAVLWLHAVDLDIAGARLRVDGDEAPVAVVDAGDGSGMRGFTLPHPIDRGTAVLVIDYTGRVTDPTSRHGKDEEGLFRERAGGRWHLYSQAESVFARKIVPCFDEPRFKPAWRVTAIIPRGLVALGNAPVAAERDLPDGRREVRFAEIAALPSYLLAIVVGPFELVPVGKLGRARIPVRLAVATGDRKRVAHAVRELPRLVDAIERYVGAPLPLAKLDLVAVPEFFGAMENPGLFTFQTAVLVGGRDFVGIAAHELAHLWFGDAVTPAWWDDLWLSEAFATWLGERVVGSLGVSRVPALAHRGRIRALLADDELGAAPLIRSIGSSSEVEPAFDAIAYDKGAAVLAMFEQFVGPAAFQTAVRAYVTAHAGSSVTSTAFLEALAAATSPAVRDALATNLSYGGTPVVELALRCDAAPAVIASVRDGISIPVCVRTPAAAQGSSDAARSCFLAGATTEHPLPAGCPPWLVGNAGGVGYYRTVWRGMPRLAPPGMLSPDELLARGDDASIAARRGELAASAALAEIATLAAARDPVATLAALEIARTIDTLVADPVRPAWSTWLANRFRDRLTRAALLEPRSVTEFVARGEIIDLVRGEIDPDIVAVARARIDRRGDAGRDSSLLAVAAARDAGALFDGLIRTATDARSEGIRDTALDALGEFPAPFAPRIVELLLDARFVPDRVWPALAGMLARGETRSAAWRAIHARFSQLLAALTPGRARDAIAALAVLCDAVARIELARDAASRIASVTDGKRTLDRTLATIERCVARRARLGDLAAALATSPPGL